MAGLRFVLDFEAPGTNWPQSPNGRTGADRCFYNDEVQPQQHAEGRTESKPVIPKQYINQSRRKAMAKKRKAAKKAPKKKAKKATKRRKKAKK